MSSERYEMDPLSATIDEVGLDPLWERLDAWADSSRADRAAVEEIEARFTREASPASERGPAYEDTRWGFFDDLSAADARKVWRTLTPAQRRAARRQSSLADYGDSSGKDLLCEAVMWHLSMEASRP